MADPGPLPAADDDPWERVTGQEDPVLLALLEAEAPEVGAVILSKLKVSRAAELLGRIPGPLARRITYAVSQISEIRPDTVARIGRAPSPGGRWSASARSSTSRVPRHGTTFSTA
jgi:flagellar motor switch protein FliG